MKHAYMSYLACGLIGISLSLGGCGGGGDGTETTNSGDTTSSNLVNPLSSTDLNVTVQSVTVSSPPIIEFTITNENSTGVLLDNTNIGNIRFALAKLIPGSKGDASSWRSYINRVRNATNLETAAMPSAIQGTTETAAIANLENLGNGRYRYTLAVDVTNPAQTQGVTYEPSLTHRLAMQVRFTNNAGQVIVKNPIYDFVPNGSAVKTTKEVVSIDSCNSCHDKLSFHGGGRIDTRFCVTCHNPGTVEPNSGHVLDLSVMLHKVHAGEHLSKPYAIGTHDYSTLAYPQDLRNCTKCHDDKNAKTPDGDNWKKHPTKEACASCHDSVDFNNHPTAGFEQKDNSLCGVCHVPYSTDPTLRRAVTNAHTAPGTELAKQFQFKVLSASYDGASRNVTVNYAVSNPMNGGNYNIKTDSAFSGASISALIGWDSIDYHNSGSDSTPAQPITVSLLSGTNNGDNTYTLTAQLPAGVSGTGSVGLNGRLTVNGTRVPVKNDVGYFAINGNLVARRDVVSIDKCNNCHENLSLHGNNRQGTTQICVICHNANATDIEVRPAHADTNNDGIFDNFSASGVDGKREEAIHFKTMIHAIHAGKAGEHGFRDNGIVVYGYRGSVNDYSHVRYPGILSNCNACHINDSYQLPTPSGTLATTVQTGASSLSGNAAKSALANRSDDLNVSPGAAACYSCHDTDKAKEHMQVVGNAVFDQTQGVISSSVNEVCAACHGPGEFKDVAAVHDVH